MLPFRVAVTSSASKHGVRRADIVHAYRHRTIVHPLDNARPDVYLVIGPDPSGNLVELAVAVEIDVARIFHAMPLRRRYSRMLRRSSESR